MSDVNSRDYWNHRFETDWTLRRGCEQSRFFANIALELMPDWLVRMLRNGATVCDWGCAMGDGTAALATALPGAKFTGIDFSPAAIEHARTHHPDAAFVCRDLLQESVTERFDVLFSSNVLEHFPAPDQILAGLAPHSGALMVHLVPFREPLANREPEHMASFDWRDLRLEPLPGWRLVHAAATDVTDRPGSLWGGEQLLFVCARADHRLELDLASVRLDSSAGEQDATRRATRLVRSELERLEARTAAAAEAVAQAMAAERSATAARVQELQLRLERLETEHRAEAQSAQALQQRLTDAMATNARLTAELVAARADAQTTASQLLEAQRQLTLIRGSRIWRWTAPLRGHA